MILLGVETPAALGRRKSNFQGRRFISLANKKGGGSARPPRNQEFPPKKRFRHTKTLKKPLLTQNPPPRPPCGQQIAFFRPWRRVSLSLSLSLTASPPQGARFFPWGGLAASGTDAIPSRDFRCRERSIFSDWKSSSAQDMSKKVSFFYSCFVFRRACPLARESSFRLDFSSWNSSSPQDMTKKEPFFISVSFFMRADSLALERRRFPELFFHIFMIF